MTTTPATPSDVVGDSLRAQRGQATVRHYRHLQRLDDAALGVVEVAADARFDFGLTARISYENDEQGMTGSLIKTTRRDRHTNKLVGFVANEGAALMLDDERGDAARSRAEDAGFRVERFQHTRSDGSVNKMGWILFWDDEEAEREGMKTWFVIADTSAAKRNKDGDNDFIKALIALLARHPSSTWQPGDAERAIREKELATGLTAILKRHNVRPWLDGELLDLSDRRDLREWERAANEATEDRKRTIKKLGGGEMNAALHDKKWPDDPATLALGLTLEEPRKGLKPGGGKKIILVDEDEMAKVLPQVELIVESTGWFDLSYPEIAAKLGAAGITTPTLVRKHGEGTTLADGSPYIVVRTVWNWIEAWAKNAMPWRYTWALGDDLRGRDDLEVKTFPDGTKIYYATAWVPFPEYDWGVGKPALEKAVANIKARRERDLSLRGSRTEIVRNRVMPAAALCGWEEEEPNGATYQYKLIARPGSYVLRRRMKPKAGAKTNWQTNKGVAVCSVATHELHQILAEGIRQTATGTSFATYVGGLGAAVQAADPKAGNRTLAEMKRKEAKKARSQAQVEEMKADRQRLILVDEDADVDAKAAAREALAGYERQETEQRTLAARLLREADELEAMGDEAVEDTDTFDNLASPLALAELLTREDVAQLPKPAIAALRQVFGTSLKLRRLSQLHVEVSFAVQLSSDHNEFVFEPVVAQAANTSRIDDGGNFGVRKDRARDLARMFMVDGRGIEELAEEFSVSVEYMGRELRKYLSTFVVSRGRMSALLSHALPAQRALLWAVLHNEPLPEGADPQWAENLKVQYTSPEPWGQYWVMDSRAHNEAVLTVDRYQTDPEQGVTLALLHEKVNATPTVINAMARTYHGVLPVLRKGNEWASLPGAPAVSRALLPFCTGCKKRVKVHVMRVPELPQPMVCPDCLIMPDYPNIPVPADYVSEVFEPVKPGDADYTATVPKVRACGPVDLVPEWERKK